MVTDKLPEGFDISKSTTIGTYKPAPFKIYNTVWIADDCIDEIVDKIVQKLKGINNAAPVVHGYWKILPDDDSPYDSAWICSECGVVTSTEEPLRKNYCPHCGAKMDGGERKEYE